MDKKTETQEELPLQKQLKPIVCPKCGGRELAFVTEYHKCIGSRILMFFDRIALIVTGFMYLLYNIGDIFSLSNIRVSPEWLYALLVFAFIYLLLYVHILEAESRTHVKVICKHCGNNWLLSGS